MNLVTERETLLHKEVLSLREQLKEKTADVLRLEKALLQSNKKLENTQKEFEGTKKTLQHQRSQSKQASEALKKRNKELTAQNERFLKQLEEAKNLDGSEKKVNNLGATFKLGVLEVDDKIKKQLEGFYNQRKLDAICIKQLTEELRESKEKIDDLENVLEAYQEGTEEEVTTPNKTAARGKKQSKDINTANKFTNDLLKVLNLLQRAKKEANDTSNYFNSKNNNKERIDFDELLLKLKTENNTLVESITVVKLTTRGFEALEKDLNRVRNENNQKIKAVRKQAQSTITNVNTLIQLYTKDHIPSFMKSTEQFTKEIEELKKVNLDDLFKSEANLQKEIIKKLQNEKEFLKTVLSKQDAI